MELTKEHRDKLKAAAATQLLIWYMDRMPDYFRMQEKHNAIKFRDQVLKRLSFEMDGIVADTLIHFASEIDDNIERQINSIK